MRHSVSSIKGSVKEIFPNGIPRYYDVSTETIVAAKKGDQAAIKLIEEAYLGLAAYAAMLFVTRQKGPRNKRIEFDEALSVAYLGLRNSIDRYYLGANAKFSTFIFRNLQWWFSDRLQKEGRRRELMFEKHGKEKWAVRRGSFKDDDPKRLSVSNQSEFDRIDNREEVEHATEWLDERNRLVLFRWSGIEGPEMSDREIGESFNLTKFWARDIRLRSIKKIQKRYTMSAGA